MKGERHIRQHIALNPFCNRHIRQHIALNPFDHKVAEIIPKGKGSPYIMT
jgi:hypothetical protein